MKLCKRMLMVMVCLVVWPVVARAQIVNPNVVEFLPPDDATGISRYEVAFYTLSSLNPYLTVDIGLPAPQDDGLIRVDLSSSVSSWPMLNVVSDARVVAITNGASNGSLHSNQFVYQCDFSLSPTAQSFTSYAATGALSVTVQNLCGWTAKSSASWLTVSSGSTGAGPGTVGYGVASNTSTSSRTATITVGGQTFTATQAAASSAPAPTAPSSDAWTFCANEDARCSFSGTKQVRYGANGIYATGTYTGGVDCTNAIFGDPVVNVVKHCDVAPTTTAPTAPTNAPPTVTITRPAQGDVINGRQVKIDATASDSDGSVKSVAFYVNDMLAATVTKAPYSVQWVPPAAGTYSFRALATDNAGATSWSTTVTASVK